MTRCQPARTRLCERGDSAARGAAAKSHAMYSDLDEARARHDLLRQIVERDGALAARASTDFRALRRVLEHCRVAAAAVEDRYCRDKLRLVEDFAAEMFSHSEHDKWQRESMSGADFLKAQILGALELFHSRLYSLEMLRRSALRSHPAVISAI